MMESESHIEELANNTVCPERLGIRAYSGDDDAVRALLALERAIDGQFIRVTCSEHDQSHLVSVGAFVLGRGTLL